MINNKSKGSVVIDGNLWPHIAALVEEGPCITRTHECTLVDSWGVSGHVSAHWRPAGVCPGHVSAHWRPAGVCQDTWVHTGGQLGCVRLGISQDLFTTSTASISSVFWSWQWKWSLPTHLLILIFLWKINSPNNYFFPRICSMWMLFDVLLRAHF